MHTLDHFALLQFRLGHSAHTIRAEICVTRLNAPQTAQVLVAGLFPLGDEIGVGDLLVDAVVVEFARDGLALVEQVVDVARLLVVYLEDGPEHLGLAFAFVRRRLGLAHLLLQLVKRGLDELPAIGRRFTFVSQRHSVLD